MEMSKSAATARRDYYREYRKKNAEKLKNYKKTWNAENKDKIFEHQKRYWERKAAEQAQSTTK